MRHIAVSRGLTRLAVIATVTTLALIALGGAVRATDSGLACPTWPGCFTAGDFVPPADLHVWLEHTHRLVAGVVGVEIAALAVWTVTRYRARRDLVWPAVSAAVLVVVQALLGAAVVWLQLRAELVTTHLGMAMVVLACLIVVSVQSAGGPRPLSRGPARTYAWTATAVALLALAQILVGGHVTGVGAGLAYGWGSFPVLDGTLVDAAGLTHREAFHVLHRALAYLLAVAVGILATRSVRWGRQLAAGRGSRPADRWRVKLPVWAATLVVLQIGIGFANLVSELSFLTVIPHLTVASWIWAVLVTATLLAWRGDARPDDGSVPHAEAMSQPVGATS